MANMFRGLPQLDTQVNWIEMHFIRLANKKYSAKPWPSICVI